MMPARLAIFFLLGAFLCPADEPLLPPNIKRQLVREIIGGKINQNPNGPQLVLPQGPFAALFESGIFPGKFLGLDPAKGIRWQHPAVAEPFHLKPGTVGFLQLQPTAKAAKANPPNCEVLLFSGDQFTGQLISLDHKALTFEATHCGRLTIPRQHIKALVPRSGEGAVLIQGFQKPTDWIFTNVEGDENGEGGKQGRWIIKNKAAICAGGNGALFGRNLPGNPQAIRVDFDLRVPQGDPKIGIQFFTDNLTSHRTGNCLDLTFRKGKASAKRQPHNPDGGQNGRIGKSIPLPPLGKRAAHVTIYASRHRTQLHLIINGQPIGTWSSDNPLQQFGAGILFIQRGNQPTHIENLVIRKSSGHAPIGRQLPELPADLKQDHITFSNGDHIVGDIKEIKNSIAICKTNFGDINLPLTKIQIARLTPNAILKHNRPEGAAIITLANQTQITGQLKIANPETLSLTTPTFGELKIPLNAIRTIDFQTPKNRIPGFPNPNAPLNPKKNKAGHLKEFP